MALFARRFLQRVLDESSTYLSQKQRRDICKLLNTVHGNYLATEWELALLHAASVLGTVRYEPKLSGRSQPDFLFANGAGLCFAADITSVSDDGLHKQNPFEALQEEFSKQQQKLGMFTGGFDIRVSDYPKHLYRGSDEKPLLRLPKIFKFHSKIFNAEFQTFMEAVRCNPEVARQFTVNQDDTSVQFSYNPFRRGFNSGNHPAFDFAAIIDQNPVYNALRSKAKQLKKSGFDGMRGIFLCDSGCRMLHDKRAHWASYRIDEVIDHFLRQHQSVAFVVTFTVQETDSWPGRTQRRFIQPTLYVNRRFRGQSDALAGLVTSVRAHLPTPERGPVNAMSHLKGRNGMKGRYLGTLTEGGSIGMSGRMLLELLAGTLTLEEFERDYRLNKSENPFRRMLFQGRLIDQISVEHHPESDDDRVTIHFRSPDAAVSPFTVK